MVTTCYNLLSKLVEYPTFAIVSFQVIPYLSLRKEAFGGRFLAEAKVSLTHEIASPFFEQRAAFQQK